MVLNVTTLSLNSFNAGFKQDYGDDYHSIGVSLATDSVS